MKPVKPKLDETRIKAILQAERINALGTSQSSDLSQQRIQAYDYYMGDMEADMPAPEGQSSAVDTSVQDVVEGILPILLDVLVSTDKIVEFKATTQNDKDAAEQETDYVNHVFYQENDGFVILYTLVKDMLLSKNCFLKWDMEDEEERSREPYKGLTEDAFAMLTADTDVKVVDGSVKQYPGLAGIMYDAIAERVKNKKRCKIYAVPPEEILVSKNARDIPNAPYWAHVQRKPMADIIAKFPEKAEIIRAAPTGTNSSDNSEAFTRQTVQDNQDQTQNAEEANKEMRLVEFVEHNIRLALEEDGIPRRYKISTVGTGYAILDTEEVNAWNLASGTSIIMPHRLFGRAPADLVIDIQNIQTSLLRATLDNAYFANNQRTEIAETHCGENTIDDLLNNRVGGIVRTKMPGGLEPIPTQPIGHWTLPLIEHMQGVKENRTGISRQNQGLDGDSLNHTATGITRVMDAAEMRVKLMARVIAETVVVNAFRGIHGTLQQFSEEEAVVELRGKWVSVDPREWKTRKHMKVTLPLGGASKQQLLAFFAQQLGVQQEVLTFQGGANGPLVSLPNVRATLDQMTKLAGLPSADPYFMTPPPPDPNAPKPPDPKMVEAQANAQAAQQEQQSDAQIAQQKMASTHQLAQQKLETTAQMAQLKQQLDHQREQDKFAHQQQLDQMKFEHESRLEAMEAGLKMRLEAFKAQKAAELNEQQAKLSAQANVGNV